MNLRTALLLPLPLLLAGCLNETASLQFAGPDHSLTLHARQSWFWRKEADLEVVMSRQPDCLRRSRLDAVALEEVAVDVLRPDRGEFAEPILILRQGGRHYAVSTQNCEMQVFKAPPQKPGTPLGSFRLEGGRLKYLAAPVPKAPEPAAPVTPPAAPPQQ